MIESTDSLYATDAYLQSWQAQVIGVDIEQAAVALDRTAFYPGGGGQPADTGTLRVGHHAWRVGGSSRSGGAVFHRLGGEDELSEVGTEVEAQLDWERRYRLMRTHTAMHVLCGVVYRDYGALVTGGNMDVDRARMDFEMADLAPERIAEIERRINEEVAADREVRIAVLPRDEAFSIPDLIRTKINLLPEGITEVRTVEIVGLDLQADGGTHVAKTGEIGRIRIVGTRSKGKSNKRLEVVIDGREGDEAWLTSPAG